MPITPSSELIEGVPGTFLPPHHGLLSWSYEPAHATGTYTLATAGTVYVVQLNVNPRLVTNIVYDVTTAGGTLTASQCFVGLYQNGVLLAASADQSTAWGSTGVKVTALSAPVLPQGGPVYAAFVFNGTTGPTLASGATALGVGNVNLAATVSRYGTANTGVTTALPASLGTVAALAQTPFVALS
jgi:hypothetical protein